MSGAVGIAVGVAVVLVVVAAVGTYVFCARRNRGTATVAPGDVEQASKGSSAGKGRKGPFSNQDGTKAWSGEGPVALSFDKILAATNNFEEAGVIENAGHSSVHKAKGPNGEQWVVKRAKRISREGGHLFRNEIGFLSHINHPHIVQFVAWCDSNNEQILVFEYVANGSLSSWLRPLPGEDRKPLPLSARVQVAVGVADALCYLHSFQKPTILHRDVKSDTILLDDHFEAKVGGLGLLKHLPGEAMRLRMARKRGYLDPEYFQTFKVTTKCDVYAFGVVLLELITGKAPLLEADDETAAANEKGTGKVGEAAGSSTGVHSMTLPQWALPALSEGRLSEIIDPRMPVEEGQTLEVLTALAQVASACVAPLRKERPDMPQVKPLLQEIQAKMAEP